MITRHRVAGEKVTINHLPPPFAEQLWIRWLRHVEDNEGGIIGFDVETTAIDELLGPFEPDAKLRLVQFGSRRYAWALDPHDEFWRPRIKALLESGGSDGYRFVSHTNYDVLWAGREFGVPADERFIDTMPMAALVHPGVTARKDLKSLSNAHIDPSLTNAETALHVRFKDLHYDRSKLPKSFVAGESKCRKAGCHDVSFVDSLRGLCELHHYDPKITKTLKAWGFTHIALDDKVFGTYAGMDTIFVRRLLDYLNDQIKSAHDPRFVKLSRREQTTQRLATQMRQRGMRVDPEWTHALMEDVEDEYMTADERLRDLWGFSPLSPKRGDWLIDHGAKFFEVTATGLPKLTMPSAASPGTLPQLAERYEDDSVLGPVFADMVTLGGNKNFLSNLRIILAQCANDGFVHPEIVTQAAHTGRMSIKKPAMQTLKKRDPRLRGCFIARDGKVLVGGDYPNQETIVAAAYSQDPNLLRIVREGLNQHLVTCESIFGISDKETLRRVGQTFYDCAKTLDFAQQYGAGPKRIAAQLDVSYAEAREMWEGWRRTYAGLVEWTEVIGQSRMIINPWGRRIPADPWRGYASGNYAVQSTGRDMLGDAIARLAAAGWGDALWLPVHDELILEVDEDEVDDAVAAIEACMSTSLRGLALNVEGEVIGQRWGAKAA